MRRSPLSPDIMLIHLLLKNIRNNTAKLLPLLFRQLPGFSGHSIKIRILIRNSLDRLCGGMFSHEWHVFSRRTGSF